MRRVFSPAAVRRLVEAQGLSISQWLARCIRIDPTSRINRSTLRRYVDGRRRRSHRLTVERLCLVAASLGVPLEEVVEFTDADDVIDRLAGADPLGHPFTDYAVRPSVPPTTRPGSERGGWCGR